MCETGNLADFYRFLRFLAISEPQYLRKFRFNRYDFLETGKRSLDLLEKCKPPSFWSTGARLRCEYLRKRQKRAFTPTLVVSYKKTRGFGDQAL